MHLRRALGAVAAAAAVIGMPAAVGAQSSSMSTTSVALMSYIGIDNLDYLDGTILTANQSVTNILINCRSEYTANCTNQGMPLPETVFVGNSFQALTYSITSLFSGTIIIKTASVYCHIANSVSDATCGFSVSRWTSSGLSTNTSVLSNYTTTINQFLPYSTLEIVSGLDEIPATTTGASPAASIAPNTATATSTSTGAPSSSSSSSKSWIAGVVIGAVAGVALLAGLVFWLLRRKKQKATQGADEAGSAPPMRNSHMSSELHSDAIIPPTELPPSSAARTELGDAAQLDMDKKREVERRAASELPS